MIRYKRPDKKKAISLVNTASSDYKFTLNLPTNDLSANTIIRNIYESFRMIGEALLISKGIQSEDHVLPINELIKLNVRLSRPLIYLDHLRKLRRNINYYGYRASKEQAEDALNFAKESFEILRKKALDIITG